MPPERAEMRELQAAVVTSTTSPGSGPFGPLARERTERATHPFRSGPNAQSIGYETGRTRNRCCSSRPNAQSNQSAAGRTRNRPVPQQTLIIRRAQLEWLITAGVKSDTAVSVKSGGLTLVNAESVDLNTGQNMLRLMPEQLKSFRGSAH